LDLTAHTSLLPIRRWFAPSFVDYKKGCTRLAAASDKAYQSRDTDHKQSRDTDHKQSRDTDHKPFN